MNYQLIKPIKQLQTARESIPVQRTVRIGTSHKAPQNVRNIQVVQKDVTTYSIFNNVILIT